MDSHMVKQGAQNGHVSLIEYSNAWGYYFFWSANS